MRVLLVIFCMVFVTSCFENSTDLQVEIKALKDEKKHLEMQTEILRRNVDDLQKKKHDLTKIVSNNGNPVYVITFEAKKSSFSLDIGQHVKDSMNSFEFNIPVDKDFFYKMSIGDEVADAFMNGSFWIGSKVGSVKIKVKDKQIYDRR